MIKSKPTTKEYRDNYDRVFAKGYQPESYVDGFNRIKAGLVQLEERLSCKQVVESSSLSSGSNSRDLPRKISVADPDPIKLNEDVVVVIKTLDGDIEI